MNDESMDGMLRGLQQRDVDALRSERTRSLAHSELERRVRRRSASAGVLESVTTLGFSTAMLVWVVQRAALLVGG